MTPGNQTSEFKLTQLIMFAGIALDAVAVLLESLQNAGLHFGWMPPVLVVVGSLVAVLAKLGYTRSRTMLKLAEVQPAAAQEVASLVPLYKELLGEVKALKAGQQLNLPGLLPPTPPSP